MKNLSDTFECIRTDASFVKVIQFMTLTRLSDGFVEQMAAARMKHDA